jgi:hypothetical protein
MHDICAFVQIYFTHIVNVSNSSVQKMYLILQSESGVDETWGPLLLLAFAIRPCLLPDTWTCGCLSWSIPWCCPSSVWPVFLYLHLLPSSVPRRIVLSLQEITSIRLKSFVSNNWTLLVVSAVVDQLSQPYNIKASKGTYTASSLFGSWFPWSSRSLLTFRCWCCYCKLGLDLYCRATVFVEDDTKIFESIQFFELSCRFQSECSLCC